MSTILTKTDTPYLLALGSINGLGPRTLHKLISAGHSPQFLWEGASAAFLQEHLTAV